MVSVRFFMRVFVAPPSRHGLHMLPGGVAGRSVLPSGERPQIFACGAPRL